MNDGSCHEPARYTIGWISALPIEHTAACLSLDQEFDQPQDRQKGDDNSYTLGRIGPHYVVLAFLPKGETGTSSAASVATNLIRTFPNVKFGLLVSVGGGAPRYPQNDIRLGDVVVATPGSGSGGVIHYDSGKVIQGKSFRRTGHLDQPPRVLRAAVTELQRKYDTRGHDIKSAIEDRLARVRPRLRKLCSPRGASEDALVRSEYSHSHDQCIGCTGLRPEILVQRKERTPEDDDDDPAIHYGLIASGNSVVRDALFRDEVADKEDVLCFEMEAAGIMNHFPCFVIRGICDYADSHKTKDWQGDLPALNQSLELIQSGLDQIAVETKSTLSTVNKMLSTAEFEEFVAWLDAPDSGIDLNRAAADRQGGTCEWMLSDPRYRQWKSRPNGILMLNGGSGSGKTIMTTYLIEDLCRDQREYFVLYFYFTVRDSAKRTLHGLLRSLLRQLCKISKSANDRLWRFYKAREYPGQPQLKDLKHMLEAVLECSTDTALVLDAIDESEDPHGVLDYLRKLLEHLSWNFRILITGRPRQIIDARISSWHTVGAVASLDAESINADIAKFVSNMLRSNVVLCNRWDEHTLLHITDTLVAKARSSFRWASLQVKTVLRECYDTESLQATLNALPDSLADIYRRELEAVPDAYKERLHIALALLLWSDRPLQIEEVFDAMALDVGQKCFSLAHRFRLTEDLLALCPSFFSILHEKRLGTQLGIQTLVTVTFAHASVRDYLLSDASSGVLQRPLDFNSGRTIILDLCFAAFTVMGSEVGKDDDANLRWTKHMFLTYMTDNLPIRQSRQYLLLEEPADHPASFLKYALEHWQHHLKSIDGHAGASESCLQLSQDELGCLLLSHTSRLEGLPFFHELCLHGATETIKALAPHFVNKAHPRWGTALQFAATKCSDEIFMLLLSCDATNVNTESPLGTVLEVLLSSILLQIRNEPARAALERRTSTVLCHNANANKSTLGDSPLRLAVRAGTKSLVRLLIHHGATVNLDHLLDRTRYSASDPLLFQSVSAVFSSGPSILPAGMTTFHDIAVWLYVAAATGHLEHVKTLVDMDIKVDEPYQGYGTPLQAALYDGHDAVVEYLISKRADINHILTPYGSLLHILAMLGDAPSRRRQCSLCKLLAFGSWWEVCKGGEDFD